LALLGDWSAVVTVVLVGLRFWAVHSSCGHICNSCVVGVWLITLSHVQWKLSTTSHINRICAFDVDHCGMVDLDGSRLGVGVRKID
jgi:hypothetical protein